MNPWKTLSALMFVILSVVEAGPLGLRTGKTTLSFATRLNAPGAFNIVEKDQSRAQTMKQANELDKRTTPVSVTNAGMIYTVDVGVGDPATAYTLLVDTGSSITFVGAHKPYTPTNSSTNTGDSVFVSYGSGYFYGEEWTDTVTLAPDLVVEQQSIGVANSTSGFFDVDGILGLGPVDLTSGVVNDTNMVPTVSDNLLSQGMISEEILGIYFSPISESGGEGQLTFGGFDDAVMAGAVGYMPLTTTSPASKYWGFDQSISYDGTVILSSTTGIVDTGTTLILIATDAFRRYQSATGATLDPTTGMLTITHAQYTSLKPLTFHMGGTSYDLPPNAQIFPHALNTAIGGNATAMYLVVGDIRAESGSGMDFVIGYMFLERYYSVYDTTK